MGTNMGTPNHPKSNLFSIETHGSDSTIVLGNLQMVAVNRTQFSFGDLESANVRTILIST